jgi:hypothetical protein
MGMRDRIRRIVYAVAISGLLAAVAFAGRANWPHG